MREIAIDNSVKYVAQSEQTQSNSRERDNKPNTVRNNSLPRKQNKNLSQNSKKVIKKNTGQGLAEV